MKKLPVDKPYILLDDSRAGSDAGQSLLFTDATEEIVARAPGEVAGALERIDAAVAAGSFVAGYFAYECAAHFEPGLSPLPSHAGEPLIWALVSDQPIRLSPEETSGLLAASQKGAGVLELGAPTLSKEVYCEKVGAVKDYILAGDIYQANFTFPIECRLLGDPLHVYQSLRARQPVPFGALVNTGQGHVMSFSPELFVKRSGDELHARPMKGTAPRGLSECEDRREVEHLKSDEKSRAENLMIVDLLRNDLSRVAEPGSVKVDDLFTVETYPTLHQMTSGVSARCDEGMQPSDLLAALFPCGSVTGAPKVRAMEIIKELELAPRGAYCGAIGFFGPGSADGGRNWSLNVPIRTMIFDAQGAGRFSVGSGIVADSEIVAEYNECLLKAEFASGNKPESAFYLIETMRAEAGGIPLLEFHMERLASSARHFGIDYDENELRANLNAQAANISDVAKVRLALMPSGEWQIEQSPLPSDAAAELKVCFAVERVSSRDPFLGHKTSRRSLYDAASRMAAREGYADILFLNEQGDVVEGAISNLFIETPSGWYTPPVSSGALPGVLRASLLIDPEIKLTERPLKPSDLAQATSIYIGNALRGLRRVSLEDRATITSD